MNFTDMEVDFDNLEDISDYEETLKEVLEVNEENAEFADSIREENEDLSEKASKYEETQEALEAREDELEGIQSEFAPLLADRQTLFSEDDIKGKLTPAETVEKFTALLEEEETETGTFDEDNGTKAPKNSPEDKQTRQREQFDRELGRIAGVQARGDY